MDMEFVLQSRKTQRFSQSETHTKRQATQHGCLPSLLGDGGHMNWNSVRWRKKHFALGRLEQPWQDKNFLYRHDKSNEPAKEGPFHLLSLSPHWLYLSFNSPQGRPLSSLSAPMLAHLNTPTNLIRNKRAGILRTVALHISAYLLYECLLTIRTGCLNGHRLCESWFLNVSGIAWQKSGCSLVRCRLWVDPDYGGSRTL